MSYQTFTARSVDEAKRAMRAALGDDAVILATRRHPDGTVEMRAIEKGKPLFKGEGGSSRTGGLFSRATGRKPQAPAPSIGGGNEPRAEDRLEDTRDFGERAQSGGARTAMSSLRGDFSRKLDRSAERQDPLYQHYHALLSRQAISDRMIEALVAEAHHAGNRSETERLSYALERVLRFAPLDHSPDAPIMLVGQTGAGKTSSAAKLAARAAANGHRVAFMSADVGRAGAIEQMTTYAEALDTRFWPIEDPQHMGEILRRERPREQIVLDTPGVSPYATADVAAMRSFREVLGAEPLLVIPASGDAAEHADWIKAFAEIGVRRCIITKFDTSRRIGAAVNGCFEAGMAMAFLSEAPFIADGLVDANPDYLAHRLLMEQPGRIASRRGG
jgi:flagellar biosynthesis protein FlhF